MDRGQLEVYIAEQYLQAYGASISSFMPLLLSMSYAEHTTAAVGLRSASRGPLFLESYLDNPAEQEVACLARQPVDRHRVVEIGNLVVTGRGGSQLLFVIMTAVLEAAGYHWFIFTATPQVEKLVNRLNFNPYSLTYAEAQRVDGRLQDWGSYYTTQPKVMAGDIRQAMTIVRDNPRLLPVLRHYRGEIDCLAEHLCEHRRRQRFCA